MVKDDSDRLSALREALRRRLGRERFELWLGSRNGLSVEGDAVRVTCASAAELQWLRRNLQTPLAECCAALWTAPVSVHFDERPPAAAAQPPEGPRSPAATCAPPAQSAPAKEPYDTPASLRSRAPRYTFENFSVGASNLAAVQTARDLVQRPGRFTPLLICGPTGSGKTHLLYAVEHAVRTAGRRIRALAMAAERFTTQFLDALARRALPSFRQKMRSSDFLLIDDVHFMENKRATLEELLYTIDALHSRGGQVVLTSDRPIAELREATPDLAGRIAAGLTTTIELPDIGARAGIVRTMAARAGVDLESAVVDLLARRVVGSARLLSGAINCLVASSMAAGQSITHEFAETAITNFCRQHAPLVRLGDIQRAVCDVFGVDSTSLCSPRKNRSTAQPRMLAMWLARRYTRAALSEIGDFFGGRSHSTVVSAQRKFEGLISSGGDILVGDRACPIEEALRRVEARLCTG